MPTYNSSKTVCESIDSVLAQTYPNWELIITDDCSSDDTYALVSSYAKNDQRIKVFVNAINSGAGVSRNNSIENANGRYIAFLDSDDLWKNKKLELQISFIKDNNYQLVYSGYDKIDSNGNYISRIIPPAKVSYDRLLKSNVIGCLTALYDTHTLGKVYMPTIRKRQDMALWLKILKQTDYAYCIPESLALYREGHQSLSSNKVKILFTQWLFYRHYLKFDVFRSSYYFLNYIFYGLKKHGVKK
ncbi:glycosyltransferase family 2 protein [Candidatus Symbiopectobacterium sp. NZEC135]|nr:glycosyltransferase family 2 protein [Candidatus Symbiopectobacterium sp. NZEC135]